MTEVVKGPSVKQVSWNDLAVGGPARRAECGHSGQA